MTIQIRAPSEIRSGDGPRRTNDVFYNTGWLILDVDRIDFTVNNDVKIYNQIDEETILNQFYGAKLQAFITGHLTADSAFEGADLFTKMKNLVLAGRQWYYDLRAQDVNQFPEFKWNNRTYDFLFQKIITIDTPETGDNIINYQTGLILVHDR